MASSLSAVNLDSSPANAVAGLWKSNQLLVEKERERVRLPFPEHIRLLPVILFALALGTIQVFQGTAPPFALGSFVFIILSAMAFNVAGGMTRPSGAYIFSFAVLAVIVGLVWKVVIDEPADSNLQYPLLTMGIYVGSMWSLLVAAYVTRQLSTRQALLANFITDANMQSATSGCLVTGLFLVFLFSVLPVEPGGILSGLLQLNRFLLLAIFLGTIHAIRRSGGTTSVNLPVLIAGAVLFYNGAVGFSKEGMITPFLCWLVAASSQRYNLSRGQVVGVILVAIFIFRYLVPYSQYGRNYASTSAASNFDIAVSLMTNLGTVRTQYENSQAGGEEDYVLVRNYYNTNQGFFNRLQMIGPDDGLNGLTEQGVVPGITPIFMYFGNLVPHFIWRNKTNWGGGHLYAQQMGLLAEDDESTGISFSPAGEAFHLMRWPGVFILAPVLWIMLFTLFDSLCGDTRKSPWGLLVVVSFAHVAPEGGLGILIYAMGYGALTLIFAAFTVTYLMPIVGELLIGPNRTTTRFRRPLRIDPHAAAAATLDGQT